MVPGLKAGALSHIMTVRYPRTSNCPNLQVGDRKTHVKNGL